jgi:cytochrome c-type biogenesis protein CcmH/NrfG
MKFMTRQKTIFLAAGMFVIGFISGIGVAVYSQGSSASLISESKSSVDYSAKIKALENEVASDPENASAWVHLGHLYFNSDNYGKAINAYEKSLTLNPMNADVLTDLGIMYRRSGQPRKAIQKFDMAVEVDPKHETARFNKGIVLMHDLGDREGAIRTWEDLLEVNPIAMVDSNQSVDQMVKHYQEGHDQK